MLFLTMTNPKIRVMNSCPKFANVLLCKLCLELFEDGHRGTKRGRPRNTLLTMVSEGMNMMKKWISHWGGQPGLYLEELVTWSAHCKIYSICKVMMMEDFDIQHQHILIGKHCQPQIHTLNLSFELQSCLRLKSTLAKPFFQLVWH